MKIGTYKIVTVIFSSLIIVESIFIISLINIKTILKQKDIQLSFINEQIAIVDYENSFYGREIPIFNDYLTMQITQEAKPVSKEYRIIFYSTDNFCSSCMLDIVIKLNQLYYSKYNKHLGILGIMDLKNIDNIENYKRINNIKFDLIKIENLVGKLNDLGIFTDTFLTFCDIKKNKILFASMPKKINLENGGFFKKVENYLN